MQVRSMLTSVTFPLGSLPYVPRYVKWPGNGQTAEVEPKEREVLLGEVSDRALGE
jgi:hypothetical protein